MQKLIRESKKRVDMEFGKKISEKFVENKKLFWKEVKRIRGGEEEQRGRMKGIDGQVLANAADELEG